MNPFNRPPKDQDVKLTPWGASEHKTHLSHRAGCDYCETERKLGGKPRIEEYNSKLDDRLK